MNGIKKLLDRDKEDYDMLIITKRRNKDGR